MAARIHDIYRIQPFRLTGSDCLAPGRHSCSFGRRLVALECVLRSFDSRRRVFPVDDFGHYSDSGWCCTYCSLWNCTGAYPFVRGFVGAFQASGFRHLFLSPWHGCICMPRIGMLLHFSDNVFL